MLDKQQLEVISGWAHLAAYLESLRGSLPWNEWLLERSKGGCKKKKMTKIIGPVFKLN